MSERKFDKHPIYNINSVIRETGIKEDTLRAWERRYDFPKPNRSKGGHRLFSDYDIETIKWLLDRQKEGMRISQAVELWRQRESDNGQAPITQISESSVQPEDPTDSLARFRMEWVEACLKFNEEETDVVLRQAFARFPVELVCMSILQMGLAEIGSRWYEGKASVQQEHFASEIATRQVQSLIFAAPRPIRAETILIGSASGETHVFSLLLITLFLKYRGWNVIYLGASVPYEQLRETINSTRPALVIGASFQLSTSVELFQFGKQVEEQKVRFAYGGRIFNLHSSLRQKFPGAFLGESIDSAVSVVEQSINSPFWKISDWKQSGKYEKLLVEFEDKSALIELEALKNLRNQVQVKLPNDVFNNASNHLSRDILSALVFEDLDLLREEVEWSRDLIKKDNLPQELLEVFFSAYKQAIKKILGSQAEDLIVWFDKVHNHLSSFESSI